MYLHTAINEIFLHSYGRKYLAQLVKDSLQDVNKRSHALNAESVRLPEVPAPPTPRTAAADDTLNSSALSEIGKAEEEDGCTNADTTQNRDAVWRIM
ncbi:MAG: hypothetical protein EOO65_04090 [Methanosarcinales archaeon]|nr:MAG: hypothetical protein EOO65_04090 [Methanosarcinales archaeon]